MFRGALQPPPKNTLSGLL